MHAFLLPFWLLGEKWGNPAAERTTCYVIMNIDIQKLKCCGEVKCAQDCTLVKYDIRNGFLIKLLDLINVFPVSLSCPLEAINSTKGGCTCDAYWAKVSNWLRISQHKWASAYVPLPRSSLVRMKHKPSVGDSPIPSIVGHCALSSHTTPYVAD